MDNLEHKTINKFSGDRNFNSSELVFDGLSIDKADYCLHGTCEGGIFGLKFNGDATANNRLYNMQGSGVSATASINDTTTLPSVFGSTTAGKPSAFRLIITGDQNTEKFINSFSSMDSAVHVRAIYYKDALLDLTSITVYDAVSRTATADIYLVQIPKGVNTDQYDLVDEVVFENRSTDIVFDNLNGDVDEVYLVDYKVDQAINIIVNNDTSNSYGIQSLVNNSGTLDASNVLVSSYANNYNQGSVILNAKSGIDRLLVSSTSRDSSNGSQVQAEIAGWYTEKLANITKISINNLSNSTGKASLYKKKPHKIIDPVPMDTLFEYEVDGDFSSGITLSGLQGDLIEGAIKVDLESPDTNGSVLFMTVNDNNGSVYLPQRLNASSSTVTAGRTMGTYIPLGGTSGTTGCFSAYLYPRSGQNRPVLHKRIGYNQIVLYYTVYNESIQEVNEFKIWSQFSNIMTCKIRISVPKGTTFTTKPILTVN